MFAKRLHEKQQRTNETKGNKLVILNGKDVGMSSGRYLNISSVYHKFNIIYSVNFFWVKKAYFKVIPTSVENRIKQAGV
jgi:hypothetical protein